MITKILFSLLFLSTSLLASDYETSGGGAGGGGDVTGPASSVDTEIPRFSGITGKVITNGSGLSSDGSTLTFNDGVDLISLIMPSTNSVLFSSSPSAVAGTANACFGMGSCTTMGASGFGNSYFGKNAGNNTANSDNNTCVGKDCMITATLFSDSTCMGDRACTALGLGGDLSVGIGALSLQTATASASVTCIGAKSCRRLSDADFVVAIGSGALDSFPASGQPTGDRLIAIGNLAGTTVTSGSDLILIGIDAEPSAPTASNEMVIGSFNSAINNVYIGEGAASASPTAVSVRGTDANAVDAVAAPDLTLRAPDKVAGTGAGANLILEAGECNAGCAGGATGTIQANNALDAVAQVKRKTTVNLTADDTVISVSLASFIEVSSDDAVATNRTFTLGAGLTGQVISLSWAGANAGELLDAGNHKLSADFIPTEDDVIDLVYDGTDWLERSRSVN